MSAIATISSYALAATLAGDAIISIKPPKFIRKCLHGVNFPEDWWWALIGIKSLAATGLIFGTLTDNSGITTAAAAGTLAYFLFAIRAHIKAQFLGSELWVNCLGMTALSLATTVANAINI